MLYPSNADDRDFAESVLENLVRSGLLYFFPDRNNRTAWELRGRAMGRREVAAELSREVLVSEGVSSRTLEKLNRPGSNGYHCAMSHLERRMAEDGMLGAAGRPRSAEVRRSLAEARRQAHEISVQRSDLKLRLQELGAELAVKNLQVDRLEQKLAKIARKEEQQ